MPKSSKKHGKKTAKRTGIHGALVPLNRLLTALSKETGIKLPKRAKKAKRGKKAGKKGSKKPSAKQLAARRKFAAMAKKRAKKAKRAKR